MMSPERIAELRKTARDFLAATMPVKTNGHPYSTSVRRARGLAAMIIEQSDEIERLRAENETQAAWLVGAIRQRNEAQDGAREEQERLMVRKAELHKRIDEVTAERDRLKYAIDNNQDPVFVVLADQRMAERDAALARVREQDALLRTFAEHFRAWTDTPHMMMDEATCAAAWAIVESLNGGAE